MIVFGAALYLALWVFVPAWPWALTSLSAQAVGSWLVPIGLGNLAVLREGDLRRARVPALTSVAYGLLQLGAVVRYSDQVRWHQAGAWIWATLLISMIVTGGYDMLATAGGTAKASPRSSAEQPNLKWQLALLCLVRFSAPRCWVFAW